jgi:AbrB family looped-hinge helix DNA binding protein
MHTVTLTANRQLTIPAAFCEQFDWQPGQQFTLIAKGHSIELVPTPTLADLRGSLRGADIEGYRDRTDRN